jgi:hypothetical protein
VSVLHLKHSQAVRGGSENVYTTDMEPVEQKWTFPNNSEDRSLRESLARSKLPGLGRDSVWPGGSIRLSKSRALASDSPTNSADSATANTTRTRIVI